MAGRKMVVGIDGSEDSAHGLRWALGHADRIDAAIRVVTTWEHPLSGWRTWSGVSPSSDEEMTRLNQEVQEALVDDVCAGASVPVDRSVQEGPATKVLLAEADDADLVVVGTRGRGRLAGALLGSVSRQVAAAAPCPVVVVPMDATVAFDGTLVVGVDGSTGSRAALRWAGENTTGPIEVIHVLEHTFDPIYDDTDIEWGGPLDMGRQLVEAFVAETLGDRQHVTTSVTQGSATTALVDAARPGSMIVMGARGATGLDGLLLGSIATSVLTRAKVPVVILPETDRT